MKLNLLFVALLSTVAFGCSSKQTTSDAAAAASASPTPAPSATPAPEAAATGGAAVTCEKGADKRTIEVVAKDKGCEVQYTKGGKTETPAKSAKGTSHCEKTRDKIKSRLESGGYKCS